MAQDEVESLIWPTCGRLLARPGDEAGWNRRRGREGLCILPGELVHLLDRIEERGGVAGRGKAEGHFSGSAADVKHLQTGRLGPPRLGHKESELMPQDVEAEASVGAFEVRLVGGGTFSESHA